MEHTALVAAIENDPGPASVVTTTSNDIVPAKRRGIDGIERADWDKPRDEQGRYLAKSDAELRAQWDREGGYAANAARVTAVETTILNASENPAALQNQVLPTLSASPPIICGSTGYGRDAGSRKLGQFLDALSPSQFETFHKWWRGLSRSDQDNILGSISL